MNNYYFLKFYEQLECVLLFCDEYRPVKSVTRDIHSCVEKFTVWYETNKITNIDEKIITNSILKISSGSSTGIDNIRVMRELGFLEDKGPKKYSFTDKFEAYVKSATSLKQWVNDEIANISKLSDISMLYNYILAALREACIYGYITSYPDGKDAFLDKVKSREEREKIYSKVYFLYGFRGLGDREYTPNANYRIISTCKYLGLIENENKEKDQFEFGKYYLTKEGEELVSILDSNFENYMGTIEYLVDALKGFIEKGKIDANVNSAAISFGVLFSDIILDNSYSVGEIVKLAELDNISDLESNIIKGIELRKTIDKREYGLKFSEESECNTIESCYDIPEGSLSKSEALSKNTILYGVPGCGKSFTIKRDYCNDEKYMERVVFHPDYTYSDFVGQILPIIDGEKISYQFVPGPFTRVLKKAHDDQENQYYLIIEEINRGNASAIFGDIFQLLDRKNGESEYSIDNQDIAKVIYENPNDEDNSWKGATGKEFEEHPIKIPSNVSILATMNTADQNVFTLDTAFKRRWKLESIPNTFEDCAYSTAEIADTGVSWQSFVETINSEIIDFNKEGIVSEDKRIGAFFLSENEIANSKLFAEKVLLYLWEDAFKYHREIFANEYQTLEDLIQGFEENKFKVFVDDISSKFVINTTTLKAAPGVEEYVQYNKRLKSQEIFKEVFDKLKVEIPSLIANTVSTKQYIRLKAENTAHANLAEVKFLADDRVKFDVEFVEEYEEKLNQQEGNCNHKYFYICDASSVDIAVDILNKSYITTKKEK